MICKAAMSICVAALIFAAAAVSGNAQAKQGVRDEVKATLDAMQAAVQRDESTVKVAEMLYAPDVIMVGEGKGGMTQGMQAAVLLLQVGWGERLGPGGQKKCRLSLGDDPGVSSPNTYASTVVLHCDPNPPALKEPIDMRGVLVWKKLPQGWRVAIEQWSAPPV